jgi:uncharacterized protein (DUF488 family)
MTENNMVDGGIFSIGHSTQPVDRFVALLKQHQIDVVADVRSTPFSRFTPQFNRENLAGALRGSGIKYIFFGKELGARADDPSCYVNGKVQYARLAAKDQFRHAITRLINGALDHRVALVCAEKEPLECHRTILVSQELSKAGCNVKHIHYDGSLETHEAALERLLDVTGLPRADLFKSKDDLLSEALELQESRIAYQESGVHT